MPVLYPEYVTIFPDEVQGVAVVAKGELNGLNSLARFRLGPGLEFLMIAGSAD